MCFIWIIFYMFYSHLLRVRSFAILAASNSAVLAAYSISMLSASTPGISN